LKGLSVLVVDDSGLIRGLLSEAVRVSDVPTDDVLEARDGGEALEILRRRHIDVVITDLQMPRVDGFELVARIAANPDLAHVRIVTMTAETAPGHSLRAARMNVYARLIKPVRFDTIQAILGDIWRSLGSP
jgi:CheY-like chemotaxis protein